MHIHTSKVDREIVLAVPLHSKAPSTQVDPNGPAVILHLAADVKSAFPSSASPISWRVLSWLLRHPANDAILSAGQGAGEALHRDLQLLLIG